MKILHASSIRPEPKNYLPMKKIRYGLLLLIIFVVIEITINTLISKEKHAVGNNVSLANEINQEKTNNASSKYDISQVCIVRWNTLSGLPYSKVPSENSGSTSFELLDKNRFAISFNSINYSFLFVHYFINSGVTFSSF